MMRADFMTKPISERTVILVVAAVQAINILDFMMVMPLGPDFATSLGIKVSELGTIGGSYTAAAAVAGIVGSFFLDRFDRRKALCCAILGLVIGTAAGGFARSLPELLLARVIAGAFGGPATSIALAIVADVIPPERRGRAMGSVMIAFSLASVLGVPGALELAKPIYGGWRTPFFATAGLGLLINLGALLLLPPLRLHIVAQAGRPRPPFWALFRRPLVRLSFTMTAVVMMAGFILIPNLSAYIQFNIHYPREELGALYLVGGAASFICLPIIGRLVDHFGAFKVGTVGAVLAAVVTFVGFVMVPPPIPMMLLFVAFMLANNLRNLSYNTLTTKVPGPTERAQFTSIQSSVSHMASAAGAFASSRLLSESEDQSLEGMGLVAWLSIGLTLTIPLFLWMVEKALGRTAAPKVALQAESTG